MPGRKATRSRSKRRAKTRAMSRAGLRESEQERKRRVEKITRLLDLTYPGKPLALTFSNPLELLTALILAAQCTDERVNMVTADLFKKYRSALDWATVDRATVESEIRSTGFYRNKAKSLQECCSQIETRFGGTVPRSLEDLVTLPGVGRKTANILRGNAFGEPAIGVDTHVGRLAQRLGLTTNTNPDKIEFDLNPIVPDRDKVRFCHLLQAHGRAICQGRKPNCQECGIHHLCPYPKQAHIPMPAKQ